MAHEAAEDTQVNSRISKSLKEQGDRVFNAIGLTPSQAIRGLYAFAASNRNDPSKIAEVISIGNAVTGTEREENARRKRAAFRHIRGALDGFYEQLGMERQLAGESRACKSSRELLDEARNERAREKGLL